MQLQLAARRQEDLKVHGKRVPMRSQGRMARRKRATRIGWPGLAQAAGGRDAIGHSISARQGVSGPVSP